MKNTDAMALSTVKKLMLHCTTTTKFEVDAQRLLTIVHCTVRLTTNSIHADVFTQTTNFAVSSSSHVHDQKSHNATNYI